ncbi:glycosyltransferase family 2 protein [Massilia alkalitolerans]|uniref:glycosyltransferase family 2 protein n=1 Tax=Massilia alkalitolerans TaxID=286638 RepID=UPI00048222C4|nr:glycosyltransferase family 2 protein [Massilia alkalitolerans]
MLTIVIPSYNHERFIADCLDAARAIEVGGRRIIVIDDGSTDATAGVVRSYMDRHPDEGIELVCKKNSGLISSLNLGLEMTETDFVYFVASDDIPQGRGIMQCLEQLQSDPSYQFCIGGGENFFSDSEAAPTPVYGQRHRSFFEANTHQRRRDLFLNYPNPVLLQSTVFRTQALRTIGGWDRNLVLDDYPTFVKLLTRFPEHQRDFLFKPEFHVVRYRHHGTNSYKNLAKQFNIVKQTLELLAPDDLRQRALGSAIGFYLLVAVRSRDIDGFRSIVRNSNRGSMLFVIPSIAKIVLRKVRN